MGYAAAASPPGGEIGTNSGWASYEEVCSGLTGHNETVLVAFDPGVIGYRQLLQLFWESHDPTQGMRQGNDIGTQYRSGITQGMRQGNDIGTQYRSGIYTFDAGQQALAEQSRDAFQARLDAAGRGRITTEILPAPPFYYAEPYHQQYLAKNPQGYCGLRGTGLSLG